MSQVNKLGAKLFKRLTAWLAVIAGAMIVAACTSSLPAPPTTAAYTPKFHIGAGDELNVSVWQNKDLSTQATVRPDDMISLSLVHDVPAAGKTSHTVGPRHPAPARARFVAI